MLRSAGWAGSPWQKHKKRSWAFQHVFAAQKIRRYILAKSPPQASIFTSGDVVGQWSSEAEVRGFESGLSHNDPGVLRCCVICKTSKKPSLYTTTKLLKNLFLLCLSANKHQGRKKCSKFKLSEVDATCRGVHMYDIDI